MQKYSFPTIKMSQVPRKTLNATSVDHISFSSWESSEYGIFVIGGRVLSEKNNNGSNMVVDLIRKQEM